MRKIKGYYYGGEKVCVFSLADSLLDFSEILEDKHIKINVESREVEKAHSFFQNVIIEDSINRNFTSYELDYSNIKDEDFFDEDFKKLSVFLEQQVEVVNTTLEEIKNDIEGGKVE